MKKVLITGGAGFIGGFLTEALLDRNCSVTVADDFSTGSLRNLAAVAGHPALHIEKIDVTGSGDRLEKIVRACDTIFHLAAAVGVEKVVEDPAQTIFTNVRGTENILSLAARYKRRTIITSTSEVYGKSAKGAFAETDDLRLGSPYRSRWSYACSKLLDEFLLMAFCQNRDFPGTVVRLFNTVGPRQTGKYGMVLPRFVDAALHNRALRVYGDGRQSRCFCHVRDVVRALILLADEKKSFGNIYNIGGTDLISISRLARKVIARTRSTSSVEFIPYDLAYRPGFEDMRRRKPDISAISSLTGWSPRHSLDEIIDDIADSLRQN
ncbi:MAG: GDP-mannose 4,6-dehydratase [Victivallaceae bacterium]|nr:GDP-mannose 4,6-dehydratase [Victivallaceae bacterium]